jgi:precorrin-6B methylase 2
MSNFINNKLLAPKVQDFINVNLKTDLQKLILKGSPFEGITIQEIATQIAGKNKSEKKLPKWFKTEGILFPPQLNLEQSSSEITAQYKKSLLQKGTLVDLTGGFGVDVMAFAEDLEQVYHCEINESLSAIVAHNAKVFQKNNIQFIIGESQEFLKKSKKFTHIFIDPSRRVNSSKVFLLKDCEPNILDNLDLYLSKCERLIIKAAPMLDISSAIADLKKVTEVHIISLNNECKELLFVIENKVIKEPKVFCALLQKDKKEVHQFSYQTEKELEITAKPILNFLYEPDAAILKAGFFKSLVPDFEVEKIHQHSHLYTSTTLLNSFPGKRFQIINTILFSNFAKHNKVKKANIITRNFDLKPEEIKKKFKINDGGETYLFFTTNYKNEKVVIEAARIK